MVSILIFLWIAFILLFLSYVARRFVHKSILYPFNNWDTIDTPYITLNIQEHDFNMIVDSGASVSIIRRDFIKNLNYELSPRVIKMIALTDDGVNSDTITVPINVNGNEIKNDFVIYDGSDIANFEVKHGITIHGILGVEFFRKTGGIVDFTNKTVKFP